MDSEQIEHRCVIAIPSISATLFGDAICLINLWLNLSIFSFSPVPKRYDVLDLMSVTRFYHFHTPFNESAEIRHILQRCPRRCWKCQRRIPRCANGDALKGLLITPYRRSRYITNCIPAPFLIKSQPVYRWTPAAHN